jgi:hypothetical protein
MAKFKWDFWTIIRLAALILSVLKQFIEENGDSDVKSAE